MDLSVTGRVCVYVFVSVFLCVCVCEHVCLNVVGILNFSICQTVLFLSIVVVLIMVERSCVCFFLCFKGIFKHFGKYAYVLCCREVDEKINTTLMW